MWKRKLYLVQTLGVDASLKLWLTFPGKNGRPFKYQYCPPPPVLPIPPSALDIIPFTWTGKVVSISNPSRLAIILSTSTESSSETDIRVGNILGPKMEVMELWREGTPVVLIWFVRFLKVRSLASYPPPLFFVSVSYSPGFIYSIHS
jgi:hypothetical protein